MAQLTSYSTLYPIMSQWLPGCPTKLLEQALRQTARAFCIETEAWREELDPILAEDYRRDYRLLYPYTAEIHRVLSVNLNGRRYYREAFEVWQGNTLRFDAHYAPRNQDDRLLLCGTAGATAHTDWTGISDGSVGVDIDGTAYDVEDLDFTACTSMDDVAAVIETGIRAAAETTAINVKWNSKTTVTRFAIWATNGATMAALTAGASGTDISGTDYMNGLTADATIGPYLIVDASFHPHLAATDLPAWFLERHGDAIMAGAVAYLAGMSGEAIPWKSPAVQSVMLANYRDGINKAKIDNDYGGTDEPQGIGA